MALPIKKVDTILDLDDTKLGFYCGIANAAIEEASKKPPSLVMGKRTVSPIDEPSRTGVKKVGATKAQEKDNNLGRT